MTDGPTEDTGQTESLGAPEHDRGGSTVDEAVESAEEGSQVEGVHTPSGEAEPGESRAEQMTEVDGLPDGTVEGGSR